MKGSMNMEKDMVMVCIVLRMVLNMLVSMLKVKSMVRVCFGIQMVCDMRVVLWKIGEMVMGFIIM